MKRLQNSFNSTPIPKKPIRALKCQKLPQNQVNIEGAIGNESCSTTWVDSKTFLKSKSKDEI